MIGWADFTLMLISAWRSGWGERRKYPISEPALLSVSEWKGFIWEKASALPHC